MTTGSSSHSHSTTALDDALAAEKSARIASDGDLMDTLLDASIAGTARHNALEARVAALEAASPPVTPPIPPALTPSAPLVITADNVTVADKAFSGTTGYGIRAVGTASNRIDRLTIRNCSFTGFDSAIWVGFISDVLIEDCTIDGAKYAGIMVLSAVGGIVRRNTVRKVGFGQPALTNAYGIAISAQNPASDPASTDVLVFGNVVEDVQTWEALDTHGGLRITFEENIVRRSRRGVMLTSGARDCIVKGNMFLDPRSNPANDQYAVVLVSSQNARVNGNTITGWGTPATTRAYLRQGDSGTVITGDTVTP